MRISFVHFINYYIYKWSGLIELGKGLIEFGIGLIVWIRSDRARCKFKKPWYLFFIVFLFFFYSFTVRSMELVIGLMK